MPPHHLSLLRTAIWVGLTLLLSGTALAAAPHRGGTLRVAYGKKDAAL